MYQKIMKLESYLDWYKIKITRKNIKFSLIYVQIDAICMVVEKKLINKIKKKNFFVLYDGTLNNNKILLHWSKNKELYLIKLNSCMNY